MADGGVQATAQTAQIFLGMAVQCTQCHNHPFNEYKQNQFWELNAFFRQTHVERRSRRPTGGSGSCGQRGEPAISRGEGSNPNKAEIFYELRNGKLKVAYPVFVDGTSLAALYATKGEDFGDHGTCGRESPRGAGQADRWRRASSTRRSSTACGPTSWATGSRSPSTTSARTITPSHPELLGPVGQVVPRGRLRPEKAACGGSCSAEPYGLSSQITERNEDDDPSLGAKPMFSRFYLRQMEAEQLYESLLVATAADNRRSPRTAASRSKQRWLQQFNTAFGTDENDEATTFNGSIPQALMLMNGDLGAAGDRQPAGQHAGPVATDSSLDNARRLTICIWPPWPDCHAAGTGPQQRAAGGPQRQRGARLCRTSGGRF